MTNIRKIHTEPEFIILALIDNSVNEFYMQKGFVRIDVNETDMSKFEFVPIDHSNNFREGELEWRVMQVMKDIYLEYIEYRNCGVTYRMIRNKKYKMERYN